MSEKIIKYGDFISTDDIIPAKYRYLALDIPKLSEHAFEDKDSEFLQKVATRHIIVGGENFGCGSSREYAPVVLKQNGIVCVLAKSFGRIFYRNGINIGLTLLECNTDNIDDCDSISIDIANHKVINHTQKSEIPTNILPEIMQEIVSCGGLINYLDTVGGFTKSV